MIADTPFLVWRPKYLCRHVNLRRLSFSRVAAAVESRGGAVALGLGLSCCRRLSPSAGVAVRTIAPFPLPAHRTGRADLLHPALRWNSPKGSRSSRPQRAQT